ncbi:MAG: c-type cytochrome [Balneolaceae bacterium]|nr:c-type cytochrome [Balneolaceae bacterium]
MLAKTAVALIALFLLASCRGEKFERQPVHPNMNMDQQERFEAQERNPFFADNRSMRQPVEGTIARGYLRQDPQYYQGINPDSSFVSEIPADVDRSFIYRGKDRYEIYCTPCHGTLGDGQGIIMTGGYGFVPAPSFHIDRLRNVENGYLYSVITNGIRNMRPYSHQIGVEDRWAIVAYVRALQRSQNVAEEDIQQYDVDMASLQDEFQQAQEEEQAREEAAAAAGGDEVSVERGEQLYLSNACQACHSRDGSDGIGPTHLNIMGRTEQLADGSSVTVDDEYLRESIVNPSAKIVEGYDPVMAPYSHLSDAEIQSLIEYMKSISDN